jgi:hypothetical protein
MRIVKSLMVVLAVAVTPGAVYAADAAASDAAAPADTTPAGVVFAMGFPETVNMDNHGASDPNRVQTIVAQFSFTNLTDRPITLNAQNECQSHTWTVTNAAGSVVESQSICPQVVQPVSLDVTAGEPVMEKQPINLHVFDYNEGQTYTLSYNYFGLTAQAKFNVQFYLGSDTAGK